MTIYLGADHRGFQLKEKLKKNLEGKNYEVVDLGNDHYDEQDDYPDFAIKVAEKVLENLENNRGILICGSGAGMTIVANKFKDIRAALACSAEMAKMFKDNDDVNILVLASDFIDFQQALKIVEIWLKTPFSQDLSKKEVYEHRLNKIKQIESQWK